MPCFKLSVRQGVRILCVGSVWIKSAHSLTLSCFVHSLFVWCILYYIVLGDEEEEDEEGDEEEEDDKTADKAEEKVCYW